MASLSNRVAKVERAALAPWPCAACGGVCVAEAKRLLEAQEGVARHCSCREHEGCWVVQRVLGLRPTVRVVYENDWRDAPVTRDGAYQR